MPTVTSFSFRPNSNGTTCKWESSQTSSVTTCRAIRGLAIPKLPAQRITHSSAPAQSLTWERWADGRQLASTFLRVSGVMCGRSVSTTSAPANAIAIPTTPAALESAYMASRV